MTYIMNIKLTETGAVETVTGNIPEIPEHFFFIPEEIQDKEEELEKARKSFMADLRHNLEFFTGCKVRKNINRMEDRLETAVNSDKYTVAETDKLRADIDALKKAASGLPTGTTANTFTRALAWSINPTITVKMTGDTELIAALNAAYVSGTADNLRAARNALMTLADGFAPSEKSRIAKHTCKMALKRTEAGKYSVQELVEACFSRVSKWDRKGHGRRLSAMDNQKIINQCLINIFTECYGFATVAKKKENNDKLVIF